MVEEHLVRLRALTRSRFGERAERLTDDADLFDVLGIDSMGALDLLTDLEEAFGVEIPDYELQGVSSLRGLAEVIANRL